MGDKEFEFDYVFLTHFNRYTEDNGSKLSNRERINGFVQKTGERVVWERTKI